MFTASVFRLLGVGIEDSESGVSVPMRVRK